MKEREKEGAREKEGKKEPVRVTTMMTSINPLKNRRGDLEVTIRGGEKKLKGGEGYN